MLVLLENPELKKCQILEFPVDCATKNKANKIQQKNAMGFCCLACERTSILQPRGYFIQHMCCCILAYSIMLCMASQLM